LKKILRLLSILLVLFIASSCFFPDSSAAMTIKTSEIASLKKGEVVQKSITEELRKGLKGSESKILIDASVKKVWNVIDDKENFPKFIHQVKKAEVIEEKNSLQKVDASIKLCKLLPMYNYIFIFDRSETYKRIKFRKVDGAFKELFGYFEMMPYHGKTILSYRIYSDPGFCIPEFICKGLRGDAIKVMEAIKTEAENN